MMWRQVRIICGVIGCLMPLASLPNVASAQNPPVLTLQAAIDEALAANPDLRAATFRATAATARIPQAKALSDPMLGVELYNMPRGSTNLSRAEDIDYKLAQTIPFPGKRHTRGVTARFDADAVAATARGVMRDVTLDVQRTYYELYRLERTLAVNRQSQTFFRQLVQSATTAYAAAESTADVPLKAQIQLAQLQNTAIQLRQERAAHLAHLHALLGRSTHGEIRLPATLTFPRRSLQTDSLRNLAHATRPELQAAHAMEQRAHSKVTEAKQQLLPDVSFAFAYKQKPALPDVWSAEAMLNLPIFFRKQRAAIQEARALERAAAADVESMRLHTQHDIAQAAAAVRAAQDVLASFRSGMVPQARLALESAQTAYASASTNFLTVVDAAKTYHEVQIAWYDTHARLGIAWAELERLVGRDL